MYLLQNLKVGVVAGIDHANGSLMNSTRAAGAAAAETQNASEVCAKGFL